MKKHWGMQSIIIAMTLIFGLTVFADQQPKQDLQSTKESIDTLLYVMKETGAQVDHIQLHYGTAYKTYEQMEEVRILAEKMGRDMGFAPPTIKTPNTNSTEYHFQRLDQNVLTELRIFAIPSHAKSGKWDSYVTIKISTDPKELDALQQQLSNVYKGLEGLQIVPQFNTCAQGKFNDTLKDDVQLKRINKLLDLLGAEVVEKVEDPTVKSFSAYSPQLPSYIRTNGKKMNVQAGMHVDQLHGLTRLTIGTPIITIEY